MPKPWSVLWLQSGGCGGCSMALTCAEAPGLYERLAAFGIELLWHPSLSQASGSEVIALLEAIAAGERPLDCLCIEGALLRGPHGSGRFHVLGGTGVPTIDWVRRLAARAQCTVAVGSCAVSGGFSACAPNPTEACGLQFEDARRGGALGPDWRSPSGLPVIALGGCAVHPDWVLETLAALALGELDAGVKESTADVRELLIHFRTRTNTEDIVPALATTLSKFEHQSGLASHLEVRGEGLPLPADAQVQVLHVVQEALSNVRKHAGASAVWVTLERGPVLRVRVRDDGDGAGFDPNAVAADHLGLRIMRERAARIGAAVQGEQVRITGTEVMLALPAREAAAA